jgi:hypothetical protein
LFLNTALTSQTSAGFIGIAGVAEAGGLGNLIKAKANNLFGPNGYQINAIANLGPANPAGCSALVASESKDVIAISDKKLSICETNYDSAFSWFELFAKFNPQSEYVLSSAVREVVSVKLSHQTDHLLPSQYSFVGGVLKINKELLRLDSAVEVWYRD